MKILIQNFLFLLSSLGFVHAETEGPLDFTPPEGATVSLNATAGIAMYSIHSADLEHSLIITKIPGGELVGLETLIKIMADEFFKAMKAQEKLVGKLSPEKPEFKDFKGENYSGKVVRFILKSEVLQSIENTNFYILSNGIETWNAHITGDKDWVVRCEKLLVSLKKK